jgi:hypothetical protein
MVDEDRLHEVITQLKAEVATGGPPSAQTLSDLEDAAGMTDLEPEDSGELQSDPL